MLLQIGIHASQVVHTWEVGGATSDSLEVVVKGSLDSILLLHSISLAEPELWVMKSVIIDLSVRVGYNLSYC